MIKRVLFIFASSITFSLIWFVVLGLVAFFNLGPRWMWMVTTVLTSVMLCLVNVNVAGDHPYRKVYAEMIHNQLNNKGEKSDT